MYDPDAIYQDADIEQAAFEAEGNRLFRQQRESDRLRAAGDLEAAAKLCTHGSGYPLWSVAATHANDPDAGDDAYRCTECGSRLDKAPYDGGTVLVPCEVPA